MIVFTKKTAVALLCRTNLTFQFLQEKATDDGFI